MKTFLSKTGKEHFSCLGISHKDFEYFFFLFLNKSMVFRAGIYKMVVGIASNGDPDGSVLFAYAFLAGNWC